MMTHFRTHDPFFISTVNVQHLKKTHHLVAVSHNFKTYTFATDLSHLMMLAAFGYRLLLLAQKQRHRRDLREVNCPASMVSVMSDATTVGKSSVKLFFLEGKLIGVYALEISIKSLGSKPLSGLYNV